MPVSNTALTRLPRSGPDADYRPPPSIAPTPARAPPAIQAEKRELPDAQLQLVKSRASDNASRDRSTATMEDQQWYAAWALYFKLCPPCSAAENRARETSLRETC